MRAALFSPVTEDDPALPFLAETAIYSQWFHSENARLFYARWNEGEVDIVCLGNKTQKAIWAVEVKWSDAYCKAPHKLKSLIEFCTENDLLSPLVTSKSLSEDRVHNGLMMRFIPASVYCYTVGFNIIRRKGQAPAGLGMVELPKNPEK
jgi:hypothetical protein